MLIFIEDANFQSLAAKQAKEIRKLNSGPVNPCFLAFIYENLIYETEIFSHRTERLTSPCLC